MRSRFDQPDSDDVQGWREARIRRSCANCLGDVFVSREEPWTLHVWCDRCMDAALQPVPRAVAHRNSRTT